jgi:hypothetical protein
MAELQLYETDEGLSTQSAKKGVFIDVLPGAIEADLWSDYGWIVARALWVQLITAITD